MSRFAYFLILIFTAAFVGCSDKEDESNEVVTEESQEEEVYVKKDVYRAPITELTDYEYPDNNDIGYMSENYHELSHDSVAFLRKEDGKFDIVFSPNNAKSDSVTLKNIDLRVYIPGVPEWIKKDTFLVNFGFTNAEWNRHQINYLKEKGHFEVSGEGYENQNVYRVDIARNCLHSGLWEVAFYVKEDDSKKVCYHGWFMFPMGLYQELFQDVNDLEFKKFENRMADWTDPENAKINFDLLRKVESQRVVEFMNLNHLLYPKTGARKSKWKNIIYPKKAESINEFLNDSTKFATFAPPGYYTTSDPRKTYLSRLAKPQKITIKKTKQYAKDSADYTEFEIEFLNKDASVTTYLILGGIDLSKIPVLTLEQNNNGFKMPMGIGNHPFYEAYDVALNNPVKSNPYYGILIDGSRKCLDSHEIGIDGPIIFWDSEDEGLLHIMILSFERHAFVGHFTVRPNEEESVQ